LPTAGPFTEAAIGVSAKPGEKAWFDLVDLRFEVAGAAPAPAAPPPAPAPVPATAPAGAGPAVSDPQPAAESARSRWEYATLTFSRNQGGYVWEAADKQVPQSTSGIDLESLIEGLGGKRGEKPASLVGALDLIGRDGWEMVGIDATADQRTHVFKRRAK
jgi:hypothetical protein